MHSRHSNTYHFTPWLAEMKTVIRDRSLSSVSLLTGWLSHHDWVSLRWRGLDTLGWAQLTTVHSTVQLYCAVLLYCPGCCHTVTSTMRSWHNYMIKPKMRSQQISSKEDCLHSMSKVQIKKFHIYAISSLASALIFQAYLQMNGWKFILFIIRTSNLFYFHFSRLVNKQ